MNDEEEEGERRGETAVYTVGHSNRSAEEFKGLLRGIGVGVLYLLLGLILTATAAYLLALITRMVLSPSASGRFMGGAWGLLLAYGSLGFLLAIGHGGRAYRPPVELTRPECYCESQSVLHFKAEGRFRRQWGEFYCSGAATLQAAPYPNTSHAKLMAKIAYTNRAAIRGTLTSWENCCFARASEPATK